MTGPQLAAYQAWVNPVLQPHIRVEEVDEPSRIEGPLGFVICAISGSVATIIAIWVLSWF